MLKLLISVLLISVSLVMSACSKETQSDCGFVQNVYGERISWKRDVPITLVAHESVPSEYIPALQAAADRWNNVAGRQILVFKAGVKRGSLSPAKDGENVIYFMNTWESQKASEQARTSLYWIGDQIKEADIRVNASRFQFYWNQGGTGVNIEALMIHELGHVLGLRHKDSEGSVMATYLANNTDRVYLAQTDQSSLSCEY